VADKENKRKPVADSHPLAPRLFVNKPPGGVPDDTESVPNLLPEPRALIDIG